MDVEYRLTQARSRLMLKHPFWGTLIMRLKFMEIDPNGPIGWVDTMAVDGKHLWYSPAFVKKLGPTKQDLMKVMGVLAHEVSHITFAHITRRGGRNPTLWNQAGDHLINHQLKQSGITVPEPHLDDPKYHDGWTTDAVYNDLAKNADEIFVTIGHPDEDGPKGDQEEQGQFGIVIDARDENGNPVSDAEKSKIESEWQVATIQAARAAKARGMLPGIVEDHLQELLNPTVPWQQELAEWMTETVRDDYAWTPPNRRMVWTGMILPGRSDISSMGELVICIDTSGSMSVDEINACLTETNSIKHLCNPSKIWIHLCDTNIYETHCYDQHEDIEPITNISHGGTYFDPVFDWIEENSTNCVGLIYLTDMECHLDRPEPHYPVVWGATTPGTHSHLPFGRVIHIT